MSGTDFVWASLALVAVPIGYLAWELLRATVHLVYRKTTNTRGKQS